MPIRQQIEHLINEINTFGHDRYILRLNKYTKELNNLGLEFLSNEISKLKLTQKEQSLFDRENEIVLPLITEDLYRIINKFYNDDNTRQAIIYIPETDDDSKFPCISVLHFLVVNDQLNLSVFMRSSNVKEMLIQDIYFLNTVLKSIGSKINKETGRLNLSISSAHIYE